MRYVAAYLLAALGGKANPSSADIEKILGSVGIECDSERVKIIVEKLGGKNVEEVIAQGHEKLSSIPTGGAVAAAPAAADAPAAGDKKEEPKKEEKKAESESDDEDLGFGLFD